MRIFAHFDQVGKIRSVICANAPHGISVGMTARPGEQVAELDPKPLGAAMPAADKLRAFARDHSVSDAGVLRAVVPKKP